MYNIPRTYCTVQYYIHGSNMYKYVLYTPV